MIFRFPAKLDLERSIADASSLLLYQTSGIQAYAMAEKLDMSFVVS
jgi:hypothetical protein